MSTHLKKVHPKEEDNWLEPLPALEGLAVDPKEGRRHVAKLKTSLPRWKIQINMPVIMLNHEHCIFLTLPFQQCLCAPSVVSQ